MIWKIDSGEKERSANDWQKITFDIPYDKLILSIRRTRSSSSATAIQALALVHQRLDGINSNLSLKNSRFLSLLAVTLKTIAYCRFPLYIPRTIGQLDIWDVAFGTIKRPLHPGQPPFAIETIPDTPKLFIAGKSPLLNTRFSRTEEQSICSDF